jgi:hypothetical protein
MTLQISNHVVGYIDVLGYKQLLKEYSEEKFLNIMHEILTYSMVQAKSFNLGGHIEIQTNVFSDNMVLSAPYSIPNVHMMIQAVQEIQSAILLHYGICLRGSITRGNFYRNSNYVYGSALINAYQAESEIAVYPRVVVGRELIPDIMEQKPILCKGTPSIAFLPGSTGIYQDNDGAYFVDYMDVFEDSDFAKHKSVLLSLIEKHSGNEKIMCKYRWIVSYHNRYCLSNSKDADSLIIV